MNSTLPFTPAPATNRRLSGVVTAMVSPFTPDGALDTSAFRRLLGRQLEAGVGGISPVGTTGESPTLSSLERETLISIAVEAVADADPATRPLIVAGTGTNDTAATVRATRLAAQLGADAALVVAPYYNRPNQRMLEAHYRAVADEGELPLVVYNVPGRTASNVEAETLLRLAEHPRVVAVKEASGDLDQIAVILRDRPPGFSVLAGDDIWTLPLLALGGNGVVSVAGNELPAAMVGLCAAALDGHWERARELHARLLPLFRANFAGAPNPAPVKAALAMMGLIADCLRLPLLPLEEPHRARLAAVLEAAGAELAAREREAVRA